MSKTINDLLKCSWCLRLLVDPVNLPCGETICGKHEEEFRELTPPPCISCRQVHRINLVNGHFPPNKIVQTLLEKNIQKLHFGELFDEAVEIVNDLSEQMEKFESAKEQPGEIVFDFFRAHRNRVDLVREKLVQNVQDCKDKILADIASYEARCNLKLTTLNLNERLESDEIVRITELKRKLIDWHWRLEQLGYDREMYDEITRNEECNDYLLEYGMKVLKDQALLSELDRLNFEKKYKNMFVTFCEHCGF